MAKEETSLEQSLNNANLCLANALMMMNVYSRKRTSLDGIIKHMQWKRRAKHWKKRRNSLEALILSSKK